MLSATLVAPNMGNVLNSAMGKCLSLKCLSVKWFSIERRGLFKSTKNAMRKFFRDIDVFCGRKTTLNLIQKIVFVISSNFCTNFYPLTLKEMSHALPDLSLPPPFIKASLTLLLKTPPLIKNALFLNRQLISFGFDNATHFCINICAFDLINQY